jgi:hypothetical protein
MWGARKGTGCIYKNKDYVKESKKRQIDGMHVSSKKSIKR